MGAFSALEAWFAGYRRRWCWGRVRFCVGGGLRPWEGKRAESRGGVGLGEHRQLKGRRRVADFLAVPRFLQNGRSVGVCFRKFDLCNLSKLMGIDATLVRPAPLSLRSSMRVESVEIFSDAANAAVMRHPGRRFPGVLVQGDTLASFCSKLDEICNLGQQVLDANTYVGLDDLRNHLWSLLLNYKVILGQHNIPLPFTDRLPPATYEPKWLVSKAAERSI